MPTVTINASSGAGTMIITDSGASLSNLRSGTVPPASGWAPTTGAEDTTNYRTTGAAYTEYCGLSVSVVLGNSTFGGDASYLCRGFIPFDLSSLSGATITAATLRLYCKGKGADTSGYGSGMKAIVVPGNQASLTALDYQDIGAIEFTKLSDTELSITDATASTYHSFPLNATGLARVYAGSSCKLAIIGTQDFANSISPGAIGFFQYNSITFQGDADANPPKLDVTYTVPGGGIAARRRPSGLYTR